MIVTQKGGRSMFNNNVIIRMNLSFVANKGYLRPNACL